MNALYAAALMILGLALIPVIYQLYFSKEQHHEDETKEATPYQRPFRSNLPSALRSAHQGRGQRNMQGMATTGRQPEAVNPERPDPLLRTTDWRDSRTTAGTQTNQAESPNPPENQGKEMK